MIAIKRMYCVIMRIKRLGCDQVALGKLELLPKYQRRDLIQGMQ
jgi:hypothetical protein